MLVRGDDAHRLGVQRYGIADELCALGRPRHRAERDIDAVRNQERHALGSFRGHELDLDAELVGDQAADLDIETLELVGHAE